MSTPAAKSEQHLKYLDSARGIAALMVFFGHFIARNFQEHFNVHYLMILFNSNDAVSFFFVLSGFVLSYKYVVKSSTLDIKQFYVSRIFRLFPAYFIIVVLSYLYGYRGVMNLNTLCDIFLYNKHEFWEEALLFRFHNNLYYPGWTLTIEMLCSFLMPFYIALAIKDKRYIGYLIVVTLIIGNNLFYSYLFLFGVLAACNYNYIASDSFKQSKWYRFRYPILIAAMLLFSIRQIDGICTFNATYKYVAGYLGIDFFTYTGLCSFVFLVAILHSKRIQRFLEHRILVFLGKISYGIYLVHILVINELYLFVDKYLAYPPLKIRFVAVTLLCTGLVIICATILHYLIELPFIRIGKRIASRIKPSLRISK